MQDQPPSVSRRGSEDIPPVTGTSTPIMDVPVDTSRECHVPCRCTKILTFVLVDNPPTQKDSQKSALSTEKSAPIAVARDAADVAAVNSAAILQGPSPVPESHTGHPAPDDDTNDTDSYLSYPSQHDSPRSSRSGTPPLETPQMLNWTVSIMNQVTSGDRRVLAQAAALRNRAKMLREQAKNVRDVVRAERGRRERLEAYFTYWREISPTWPTEWIYDDEEE